MICRLTNVRGDRFYRGGAESMINFFYTKNRGIRMKKIVFMLCMSLAVTMCASPCKAKQEKVTYKYKASNKTLTISGKYLKGKLPEGMMGAYDETIRYDYKWSSLSGKVKKVVLKKGVERIGHNAFGNFTKLKSVRFPKTLKRIDAYAFSDTQISSLQLPDNVTVIGEGAFYPSIISGKIKTIKLPAKLKIIGKLAFEEQKFTELTIPANVEKIGAQAFSGCQSLKKIVIKSKKLKKIGSRAFATIGQNAVIYIPKEREIEYRKMIEDSTAHAQIIAQ